MQRFPLKSVMSSKQLGSLTGLTLIEVLTAAVIFSMISVSLYLLLRTGIQVRKRIESERSAGESIYLNLERISQELRNVIIFRENEPESPALKGDKENMEFYTLLFDYPANCPRISRITYSFNEGVLSRIIKDPLTGESLSAFDFLENLEKINFYYFDGRTEKWQDNWEDIQVLAQGVRIELTYRDRKDRISSLNKYVFISR